MGPARVAVIRVDVGERVVVVPWPLVCVSCMLTRRDEGECVV